MSNYPHPFRGDKVSIMVDAFIEAAIFFDADEDSKVRVTKAGRNKAKEYIERFLSNHPSICKDILSVKSYGFPYGGQYAAFGHDLYLTSQGHGAGFWDRSELKEYGIGDCISRHVRDFGTKITPIFYRGWLNFQLLGGK